MCIVKDRVTEIGGVRMSKGEEFESKLARLRPWLVLLSRLHLDVRFAGGEASDVAQEAMCDAIKYRKKIEPLAEPDLKRWLRRVLKHKVIDFYRRQKRNVTEADLVRLEADVLDSFLRIEHMAVDRASSPSRFASKQEEIEQLAKAMESLPESHREVVVLKDMAGWTLQQIADSKGCTLGVIAGRLRRGRAELWQEMRGEDDRNAEF